eukprot:TRINITY_DN15906_c0_g1_i1.p1 TRINITY_DN15906_c0_g1~~TRINITY_DN15906_c0_g1_i1.p1  ORF type:complete len:1258 (+),score=323.97 TRINITY_DN15906_c0_g1_i1:86-3859(+)
MDLQHATVLDNLQAGAGKQTVALLDIISELNLGRDCAHWLTHAVTRGCADNADPQVRKLTYHIVRSQEQAVSNADYDKLRKALAHDLTKQESASDVALHALRLLRSLRWDRLQAFVSGRPDCVEACLGSPCYKVREEALEVLQEVAAAGPRAAPISAALAAAHTSAFMQSWGGRLSQALLDSVDAVSGAAFRCLRELLRRSSEDELKDPRGADQAAAASIASDFDRLLSRACSLGLPFRVAALRPLTLVSLWSPDPKLCADLVSKLICPTLQLIQYPQAVEEAGRCGLRIAAQREDAGQGLVASVATAVAEMVSSSDEGAHCSALLREVARVLHEADGAQQWTCAVKFLNAATLYEAPADESLRLLLLSVGFDSTCRLAVMHASRRLLQEREFGPPLWNEFTLLRRCGVWSVMENDGTGREVLVYVLCTTLLDIRAEQPGGDAAALAAWCGVAMECVSMCLPCFRWESKQVGAGVMNAVLRLCMSVHADGVVVLDAMASARAATQQTRAWANGARNMLVSQVLNVTQLITTHALGPSCRTETKVALFCVTAALFPIAARQTGPDVTREQANFYSKLTGVCKAFMSDECRSQCIALVDSLLSFGARRGGADWAKTEGVVESILHDAGRSGAAPQVLQMIKPKLDNLRRVGGAKLSGADGGMSLADISACGVSLFSPHHPALHSDLSPTDHALQFECHEARAALRSARRPDAEDVVVRHAEVITAPDEPVQVLAAYTWRCTRVELCLSVSNVTPVQLRDVRVTVGCHGDIVPLCRPHRPDFDPCADPVRGLHTFDVNPRYDSIKSLGPGNTAELDRVFLAASLTPGMGFSVVVDASASDGGDVLELGAGGDDARCRMWCDFLALRLEHHFTEQHGLCSSPGKGAAQLISQLPHCSRLHTYHPGADLSAIERRVRRVLSETPLRAVSCCRSEADSGAPLSLVFAGGLRGGGIAALTVSGSQMPGGERRDGATEGIQQLTAGESASTAVGAGGAALVWLWQSDTDDHLNCITRHPDFKEFFERVADCGPLSAAKAQAAAALPASAVLPDSAYLAHWQRLRRRREQSSSAKPCTDPDTPAEEADWWESCRCEDLAAAAAAAASDEDASLPGTQPDIFGSSAVSGARHADASPGPADANFFCAQPAGAPQPAVPTGTFGQAAVPDGGGFTVTGQPDFFGAAPVAVGAGTPPPAEGATGADFFSQAAPGANLFGQAEAPDASGGAVIATAGPPAVPMEFPPTSNPPAAAPNDLAREDSMADWFD